MTTFITVTPFNGFEPTGEPFQLNRDQISRCEIVEGDANQPPRLFVVKTKRDQHSPYLISEADFVRLTKGDAVVMAEPFDHALVRIDFKREDEPRFEVSPIDAWEGERPIGKHWPAFKYDDDAEPWIDGDGETAVLFENGETRCSSRVIFPWLREGEMESFKTFEAFEQSVGSMHALRKGPPEAVQWLVDRVRNDRARITA